MEKQYSRPKKILVPMFNVGEKLNFPQVPDGYDPKSEVREITPENEKNPFVEIDGFKIENELDENEEPIVCSRESPVNIVDYSNMEGICELCKTLFPSINDSVIHIHMSHGVLGGSQHMKIDTCRLVEAGYISIPKKDVECHKKDLKTPLGNVKEEIEDEDKNV